MNIRKRLCKLEDQANAGKNQLVIIALDDGETEEQAYQRCFPDGSVNPKLIIYVSALDVAI